MRAPSRLHRHKATRTHVLAGRCGVRVTRDPLFKSCFFLLSGSSVSRWPISSFARRSQAHSILTNQGPVPFHSRLSHWTTTPISGYMEPSEVSRQAPMFWGWPKMVLLDPPRSRDISVTVIRHKKSWIQPRDDLSFVAVPDTRTGRLTNGIKVHFDFSEGVTAFATVGVWSTEPPRCDRYGSVSWPSQDKS